MKTKRFPFKITARDFYNALVDAVEELQWEQGTVIRWLNPSRPLPPKLEITRNIFPIRLQYVRGPIKSHTTMETVEPDERPEHFFGLRGIKSGHFGLRNEAPDLSILSVESEDPYRPLFERIFEIACLDLEQRLGNVRRGSNEAGVEQIPPEPAATAGYDDWFRCYYERRRIGKGRFTLDYVAKKIALTPSKTRYYAALWKAEHIGSGAKKRGKKTNKRGKQIRKNK
jgi:hypothetical protein